MELVELWELYRASRLLHASEHTTKKYRYAIQKFDAWTGRRSSTDDLSDDNLVQWRAALMNGGRLSRATVNSYVSHVVALWNYAWRRRIVQQGPTIKELAEVQREPVSLTIDEFSTLLKATAKLNYWIAGVHASDWWRSLFLALYDTGWRVSACRSVLWSDVRLDDQTILVRGEHQKNLRDSRKLISDETVAALKRIVDPRRKLVWEWDRGHTYFWQLSKRIFLSAGLPDDRRYGCHAIRKTHGTMVASLLGDFAAADSLQHANVETFRRHYRDGTKIDARDVLDALPRPKVG